MILLFAPLSANGFFFLLTIFVIQQSVNNAKSTAKRELQYMFVSQGLKCIFISIAKAFHTPVNGTALTVDSKTKFQVRSLSTRKWTANVFMLIAHGTETKAPYFNVLNASALTHSEVQISAAFTLIVQFCLASVYLPSHSRQAYYSTGSTK